MHRHGYKGRKFDRETDQRRALIKGLADSFVLNEKLTTTLPKAKEIVPYIEKLITKAKIGSLHSRRQVITGLQTIEAAHKLVDEIAPKLTARSSGHVRITKTVSRRGDNTMMAIVSFVDDLSVAVKKPVAKPAVKKVAQTATAKATVKTERSPAVKRSSTAGKTVKKVK